VPTSGTQRRDLRWQWGRVYGIIKIVEDEEERKGQEDLTVLSAPMLYSFLVDDKPSLTEAVEVSAFCRRRSRCRFDSFPWVQWRSDESIVGT
jgi:hypothetical protein